MPCHVINNIVSERTSKVNVPSDKALEFHTANSERRKRKTKQAFISS